MLELLRYIYADKVKNIGDIERDLLAAANKYGLDRLKALCEEELIAGLNVENIGEILILADCHKADTLKSHAIQFLGSRAKDVLNTNKFKTDMKSMSPLFLEVLTGVLNT